MEYPLPEVTEQPTIFCRGGEYRYVGEHNLDFIPGRIYDCIASGATLFMVSRRFEAILITDNLREKFKRVETLPSPCSEIPLFEKGNFYRCSKTSSDSFTEGKIYLFAELTNNRLGVINNYGVFSFLPILTSEFRFL